MATPKTPRKSAVKSKKAGDATVGKATADAAVSATADKKATTEHTGPFDQSTPATKKPTTKPSVKAATVSPDENVTADIVVPKHPHETKSTANPPAPPVDSKEDLKPTTKPVAPAPVAVKSGPGFVPLVLGGIVAAGIGFGLARYVVPEGWPTPGSSPLQAQLTQQAAALDELRAQVDALPKEDSSAAFADEIKQLRTTSSNALEVAESAKLAAEKVAETASGSALDVGPEIAALTSRLSALESRPAEGTTDDSAVIETLKADIVTLRSGLAEQKAAIAVQAQDAEAARAEISADAKTVLLQAALTQIDAAMQNGQPFAEPLEILSGAGLEIPQTLTNTAENGVPTAPDLAASLDAPARAALKVSLKDNMGSTWSERAGSFLRTQTGARSLTPREGDDPDAVLSRANAAASTGDLQTALAEIETLPEAAQAALSDWVAQAKLRLDAQAATAELSAALSER